MHQYLTGQRKPTMSIPNIPMMMITSTEIRSAQTNMPIFLIEKSSGGLLSGNALRTIVQPGTGQPMGTYRFSSLSESVEITVNGRATKMKEDGHINFRYSFHPTFDPGLKWFWSEKKGDLRLTDWKDGPIIATISGNMLACEQGLGLTAASIDEIVITGIAVLKKHGKMMEALEIAGAVAGA